MKTGGGDLEGMGYLDLYRALEEEGLERAIESWKLFAESPELWISCHYDSEVILPIREFIARKGADDRVRQEDIAVFKKALELEADPYYFEEGEEYPLSHWWFYLDRISERTYPAELLPEYLREIYLKAIGGDF